MISGPDSFWRGPAAPPSKPIRVKEEIYLLYRQKGYDVISNPVLTYHPTIVIGWAMENLTLSAMFRSKKRFDMRAIANCAALIPINLIRISNNPVIGSDWGNASTLISCVPLHSYQGGSSTYVPEASMVPGGTSTRQGMVKAQILKAEARGPNVPATRGKAVDANHHRL